ncbi:MAG: GNAT family N-acetyltransferase [Microvirga sp.]|nr:GNAT family N-acetyltransferase [Microvirga sp.]
MSAALAPSPGFSLRASSVTGVSSASLLAFAPPTAPAGAELELARQALERVFNLPSAPPPPPPAGLGARALNMLGNIGRLGLAFVAGRYLTSAMGADGEIAGLATFYPRKLSGHLHVNELMVDPSQRGGGFGEALMQELWRRAQAEGLDRIRLEPTSDAFGFYERLGGRRIPQPAGPDMIEFDQMPTRGASSP